MAKLPRHQRRVLVVGVGDDGPSGLHPAVLDRVKRADLLVGGRRHHELFPDILAQRAVIAGPLDRLVGRIERMMEYRRVVVLASGDPCFFGIGPMLAKRLGRARVEIVPHVSSVALAFARLGLSWHDARVVSAHGRPLSDAVQAASGATRLAVLTDETNTPGAVAQALLHSGAVDAPAWVFEHLGSDRECEVQTTLAGLSVGEYAALNVLVVPELSWARPSAESSGTRDGSAFGLPASEYAHTANMITKPEVRAVSLSKLRLRPGSVLWDVGAGSGSLAIEAVKLAPGLRAFAVERSELQCELLRQNVASHADGMSVEVVHGVAPEALRALPAPDSVFVGGSGGLLVRILELAQAHIRPNGRIVANLVTYEHVTAAVEWARGQHIQSEVVQVSIARGSEILGMTRLQAENPVTVLTLFHEPD